LSIVLDFGVALQFPWGGIVQSNLNGYLKNELRTSSGPAGHLAKKSRREVWSRRLLIPGGENGVSETVFVACCYALCGKTPH